MKLIYYSSPITMMHIPIHVLFVGGNAHPQCYNRLHEDFSAKQY